MYKNFKQVKNFVDNTIMNCSILIVGDMMLDKYYFGEVKRISPEAPVPIARVHKEKTTLGGAANVAHNLALLGCKTLLCGVVGQDEHAVVMGNLLKAKNIQSQGLMTKNGPTTTKLRIIGGHQQMLRLDFEETSPITASIEKQMQDYIVSVVPSLVSSVIISDYGKGVCTLSLCQFIIEHCIAHNVPVIVDPKGNDWQKYGGASYITPNLAELNEAVQYSVPNEDVAVKKAADKIRRKYKIKNLVVTRSEQGLSLIGSRSCTHIPTYAQEVFDVSGAGDTVIAVLGAALGSGLAASDAAYLANMAAGVVVGKVGTYAISRQELLHALDYKE
jgi:rfaE bifunctional protein kinase chain/domain